MQEKSSTHPQPLVTYSTVVGKTVARTREVKGLKQGDVAAAVGLSQSAYSRVESGDSTMNLAQLRSIAAQLQMTPGQLVALADQYEMQLRQQGVEVASEKPDNPAALAIGLGLLAALLLSSSK
jgi:transcriptional regulator with XRE-family HTH domain